MQPVSPWPDGARCAVSVVVNFEEGAQLSVARGDDRNESVYEAVDLIEGAPNFCMESHFDYGLREGWPRIRKILREHGVKATINACGRAVAETPSVAAQAVADGHEVAGHGWRWESPLGMSEAEERLAISRTVDAIAAATGRPPTGWHVRSTATADTRRLLVENGNFLYDSNAYDTDTPYIETLGGVAHVVLPYAFDTNDMRFFTNGSFVFAEDFSRYCLAALDRLLAEGQEQPRMLTIGLHLRMIGPPARIDGLTRFLEAAISRPDVWFARRDEIAHAWRRHEGLPSRA